MMLWSDTHVCTYFTGALPLYTVLKLPQVFTSAWHSHERCGSLSPKVLICIFAFFSYDKAQEGPIMSCGMTLPELLDVDGAISGSHYCAPALPLYTPTCSLSASFCSLDAPSKRPCFLSRSKTAISIPKFGVYIIYI